jgi:hypothetical protein
MVDRTGLRKANTICSILFNLVMYVVVITFTILIIYNYQGIIVLSELFKGLVQFFICVFTLISGYYLVTTIKKIYCIVPRLLVFWLSLGGFSSCLKFFQEIFIFFFKETTEENLITIFFLANFDEIVPSLVFLNSFTVYSKFFIESRNSTELDISVVDLLDN